MGIMCVVKLGIGKREITGKWLVFLINDNMQILVQMLIDIGRNEFTFTCIRRNTHSSGNNTVLHQRGNLLRKGRSTRRFHRIFTAMDSASECRHATSSSTRCCTAASASLHIAAMTDALIEATVAAEMFSGHPWRAPPIAFAADTAQAQLAPAHTHSAVLEADTHEATTQS